MKKIVGLLFAVAFGAMMLLAPFVSASVVSVEWTDNKNIKDLTTLDFTSSFVVTGTSNFITIEIHNDGPAYIWVTKVKVRRVTPRAPWAGYTASPAETAFLPPISIAAGATVSLPAIEYTSQTGANVHLWVYFTISGQEYHIGVNLHFR